MELIIRNTTNQPIYDQIYSQIKAQIIAGKLSPGEALPSIRALAKDLRISVITTKRAYDELEADGFLHREVYPEVPPRVEYTLTAMGESFLPVLNHMLLWSETHLCPPDYVNPYQDGGRGPLPGTEA